MRTLLVGSVVWLAAAPLLAGNGSAGSAKSPAIKSARTTERARVSGAAAQPSTRFGARLVDTALGAGVTREAAELAVGAVECAVASGDIDMPPTLTIIDYSRPSLEPRLWVLDVATGDLLFRELVAHGKATGDNMAEHFSDEMDSHQTSLGLFVAADTYVGSNGYSLRLDGLEPGFNGRARERAIVMHGAPYVDATMGAKQGRLGRSWGCPALREAVARKVIDTVRGGGVIFSFYPDSDWLARSRFLNCGGAATTAALATN